MDFLALATSRRCVRAFLSQPVSDGDLRLLLEAARRAPSAGNLQPWHFYAIRNADMKAQIVSECFHHPVDWMLKAPVWIIVTADPEKSAHRYHDRGGDLYCIQDTAAAIENILLCATSLGLGACWVGAFSEPPLMDILNLKGDVRPVAILPIGHAEAEPTPTSRDPVDKIATFIE